MVKYYDMDYNQFYFHVIHQCNIVIITQIVASLLIEINETWQNLKGYDQWENCAEWFYFITITGITQ